MAISDCMMLLGEMLLEEKSINKRFSWLCERSTELAKTIYNNIEPGTPVVCYE